MTGTAMKWSWVVAGRTGKQANFFVMVVKPRIIYAIT